MVFFGSPRHAEAAREHAAPHESPWTMTAPLVVLAVLSVVGGALNLPWKSVERLAPWLEPVFEGRLHELSLGAGAQWTLALGTLALALVGIAVAALVYLRHRVPEERVEPVVLQRAWYVDRAYALAVEAPGRAISTWSAYVFDLKIVDGAVNGVAALVRGSGERLRRVQTGYVRNYALGVVLGAVALLAYVALRAQAG
jgi:NADH-quinone oxidoreductase subunit L